MAQSGFGGAEISVETGPLAGTRFLLDRPLATIGRADDNDVRLDDDMVSKHHCRVITQGDNYLVEDLGSSNGTIVNGQPVNSHMLQDGDKLFLGDTTLQFRKAGAPAAAAAAGVAGPVAAKSGASKKWIWITAGVVGGLVIVATAIVLVLLLVVLPERDSELPVVTMVSPSSGQTFELEMPVPKGTQVTFAAKASDNKGLDRIEFFTDSDAEPYKTIKATTSRKETAGKGVKSEDFSTTWTAEEGDHKVRAKIFDWKGNAKETEAIVFKIEPSPSVRAAHAYCQQIDQMAIEYSNYRGKFNTAYTGAQNGTISYPDARLQFEQVRNERQSLLERLNSTTPPGEFNESHAAFKTTVTNAMNADEAAIKWATAEQYYNDPYYGPYYSRYYPYPPSTYKAQVEDWSGKAQQSAANFNSLYPQERREFLGVTDQPPKL